MRIYKNEKGKLIIDGEDRTKVTFKKGEIKEGQSIQDKFLEGIDLPNEVILITRFHIKVED